MAESVASYTKMEDLTEGISQTYNANSGCDILATLDGILLGNLNGISFSTTREKAPIYVMGSVDAVSFGRGKRGHAGSLIFTNFDRHAMYDIMEGRIFGGNDSAKQRYWYYQKRTDVPAGGRSTLIGKTFNDLTSLGIQKAPANYSDQIPPFTITLTALNEYGNVSVMHLLGVELINEGSGISIDDIVTETQMTFVARGILGWRPITDNKGSITDASLIERLNRLAVSRQAEQFQTLDALG